MKFRREAGLATIMIFVLIFLGIAARAATVDDLRLKIQNREEEIKKIKEKIKEFKKKIDAAEIGIEKLSLEIGEKNEAIRSRRIALAGVLRSFNEADSVSFVEILLRNQNFSEFFNEIERFQSFHGAIVDDLGELKNLKWDLEEKESVKQDERFKLENLASELCDRKLI